MALLGAVITGLLGFGCLIALVKVRQALQEVHRIRALKLGAKASTIRDAPCAGTVLLTGTVKGKDSRVVTAPFTGDAVLWARASAQVNVDAESDAWTVHVDELELDDGSGIVAHVKLAGANVRVKKHSVPVVGSLVTAYFNSIGRAPGSSEHYWQMVVRPGDVVSVLATVATVATSGGGYREKGALVLSNAAAELIVFDPAREDAQPTRFSNYARMAMAGIVVFGLATVLLAIVGIT